MGKNRENVLGSKVGWKFRCGKEVWKIFAGCFSQRDSARARANLTFCLFVNFKNSHLPRSHKRRNTLL